jgi:hypothetical protein
MIFKEAFEQTIAAIKRHKLLFATLFAIQAIFLIIIGIINVKYQLQIATSLQGLITPLQTANYNPDAIQAGTPFLKDIASFYQHYNSVLGGVQKLIAFQLLAFVAVGSWLWILPHFMFDDAHLKEWILAILKRTVTFLLVIFSVVYVVLADTLSAVNNGATPHIGSVYGALAAFLVGTYFMIVCLALPARSWWKSITHAFTTGIAKIHYTLGTLLINAAILGGVGYLVVLSVEWPFWLMILIIIVFISAFILTRTFYIAVMRTLDK